MAAKKGANAEVAEKGVSEPEKKIRSTLKYPPYVYGYGSIPKLFGEIKKASVPPKFTQDFLETVLELKSSSQRALIPLLKKLNFIDAANSPTEAYKAFRDEAQSGAVMASQLRVAYADLYKANEYAHNLTKSELQSKLRALVGASDDDANIPAVAGTFGELAKLADFKASVPPRSTSQSPEKESGALHSTPHAKPLSSPTLGLSYTINLNLPATTEIEVFNAIFKSLKDHLLDG